MSVTVDTSGRIYDDFNHLLFLHVNREVLALTHEIPEESGQFRLLRADFYDNIKGSVGLILVKAYPHDEVLSSRSFEEFNRLLFLLFIVFSVTLSTLGLRPCFFCCK
jgi:hypothetical protein